MATAAMVATSGCAGTGDGSGPGAAGWALRVAVVGLGSVVLVLMTGVVLALVVTPVSWAVARLRQRRGSPRPSPPGHEP